MVERQNIFPEGLSKRVVKGQLLYAPVVTVVPGKLVFLSGILARNSQGEIVGRGDMRAQIRQVFSNITTALAAAGATWADVVKRQTFTTDIDAYFENIDARAPINLNEVIRDVMTITARPIESNNIVLNANRRR